MVSVSAKKILTMSFMVASNVKIMSLVRLMLTALTQEALAVLSTTAAVLATGWWRDGVGIRIGDVDGDVHGIAE